jgi:WD40 repeat protein
MNACISSVGLALAIVVLGPVTEPRLMAQQPLVAAAAKQDTTAEIKKFAQAQDAAAHKAYDIAMHSLKNGVPGAKPEDVHTLSVRRLKAQRELSSKPAEHIAALSDHRKRMRELAKIVDQLVKVGVPGLPGSSAAAADFYVAEAELLLAVAARGARAEPRQGAREAQGRLEQEKARTEHQRLRAETARYAIQLGLAQRAWQENNLLRAREVLGECPVDLRGWEYDYLQSLCRQRMRSLQADCGSATSVAFSPDGKRLAAAYMGWGIPGKPGQVKVWDVVTGQEIIALKLKDHEGAVSRVAFSPDGKWLAGGSHPNPYKPGKPGQVKVWDVATGQEVFTLKGHSDDIASVAFSPDGKRLASGSADRTVRVWNTAGGRDVLALEGHTKAILSVAFRPDGKHLASGSLDGTVKLWDVVTGREVLTIEGHGKGIVSVAFRPDGKRLAGVSVDGTARLWDGATGREVLTIPGHTQGLMGAAFGPDGKHLAAGSFDGTVKLWEVATGRELPTLKGHTRGVSSVAFSPDGKRLASASHGGTVNVWNLAINQESYTVKGHTDMVTSVAFSPDSKRLASASLDRSVKVWNVDTGEGAFTLSGHMGPVRSVAFSPDGKRLASGGGEDGKAGAIEVWDLQTRQLALTLKGHTDSVVSVAFGPDGQRLASASPGYGKAGGGMLKLWDLQMGREALPLWGPVEFPTSVAYSPDGKRLASAGGGFYSQAVQIWDAATGKQVLTLRKQGPRFQRDPVITSVCFSPDGRHLASARWGPGSGSGDGKSHPGEITIWDLRTGQEMLSLKGHNGDVLSVVFHPDGRRLATASEDKTVKVWYAATGQEVLSLKSPRDGIARVAFSPDGERLAGASYDGTVRVWTRAGSVGQENR